MKKFLITAVSLFYFLTFLFSQNKTLAASPPTFCNWDPNTEIGFAPLESSTTPNVGNTTTQFKVTIYWSRLIKSDPPPHQAYHNYDNTDVQILVLDTSDNVQTGGGNSAIDDHNSRNGSDRSFVVTNFKGGLNNIYDVVLAPGTWAPGVTNYCVVNHQTRAITIDNSISPPGGGCPPGTAIQNQKCIVGANGCTNPNDLNNVCKPGLVCDHDPAFPDAPLRGLCEPPNVTLNPTSNCPQVGDKCNGTNDTTSCTKKGCPTTNITCQPIGNGKFSCQGPTPIPNQPSLIVPTFATFNTCPNGVCNTAIGNITAQPENFITTLFRIALSVGGTISIFLIIYSGYELMTSHGEPQKVQGAKETITAAIVGLLFIVFSLVILETIGVDILHIPGFIGSKVAGGAK